ncbi:methyltransferase type 11 [Tamlana nanhaiensis]|uniref:Methyltransferase type 11 n=1 Tax=Neotamlana nanhaiensis TaxID=1382798 RepID=A0A0D7VXU6_9FLAO|nr:methyltransferase domain-containing protein [Tamlana nanhaiensis]KJD31619.1 methyltransferase type 11 [Tamlana nanhaiensis]
MEIKRKKFQGVLNIISFNRHFYFIGFLLITITIAFSVLFNWSTLLFVIILSLIAYSLIIPLIVSAYVYDFSKYYNFDWLKNINLKKVKNIANIHAGFDETSHLIKSHFPKTKLHVFDFYNKTNHTEKAIIQARSISQVYPNTISISTRHIPLKTNSLDVVFLLSAAHEIRSNHEKETFLKECYRICKPNGHVIMVEHLRDSFNFLAFSVGFTHFFSKTVWLNVFRKANFHLENESKFTPFMSIFNFTKQQ